MEANKKRIFILDIIFFVVLLAVGGYFFYRSAPEATAPDNESMVTSTSEVSNDLPEGVIVEDLENGNKLVKNEKDGYEVEVSKSEYIYKTLEGKLRIQDYKEPEEPYGGLPGCEVDISKIAYSIDNSVDKEASSICDDLKPDCNDYKIESIDINGKKWDSFYFDGSFVGAGWPKYSYVDGNKQYKVYFKCNKQEFIDNILNNFSF
ncbi:MAG: hypothetical protein ACD_18C00223G0006 [uncultured bacterium]|nr:MAG: hypothetical protein ACD_18C00223G0006 [uncultured bacterium]